MIKVTRSERMPKEVATLAQSEETRNSTKPKRTFRVYKNEKIKKALHKLFHGKCAYCESRYAATQPMDVEHWRPKSVYWFLAADWENLYPSCIDCNRQREHTLLHEDGTERTALSGKLNIFPLVGKCPRAVDRSTLSDEKPVLLNPCSDDPEQFFEYVDKGVMRSHSALKASGGSARRRRSEKSIEIYALNRVGLVNERYQWQLLIGKHIHRIRQLSKAMELVMANEPQRPSNRDLAGIIEDLIRFEMVALKSMCHESQPYSAQSKQLVREFLHGSGRIP